MIQQLNLPNIKVGAPLMCRECFQRVRLGKADMCANCINIHAARFEERTERERFIKRLIGASLAVGAAVGFPVVLSDLLKI